MNKQCCETLGFMDSQVILERIATKEKRKVEKKEKKKREKEKRGS